MDDRLGLGDKLIGSFALGSTSPSRHGEVLAPGPAIHRARMNQCTFAERGSIRTFDARHLLAPGRLDPPSVQLDHYDTARELHAGLEVELEYQANGLGFILDDPDPLAF